MVLKILKRYLQSKPGVYPRDFLFLGENGYRGAASPSFLFLEAVHLSRCTAFLFLAKKFLKKIKNFLKKVLTKLTTSYIMQLKVDDDDNKTARQEKF